MSAAKKLYFDWVNRRYTGYECPAKDYFRELRGYIYTELRENGRCDLIDYLFDIRSTEISVITMVSATEAMIAYLKGERLKELGPVSPFKSVEPGIIGIKTTRSLKWDELKDGRMTPEKEFIDLLYEVMRRYEQRPKEPSPKVAFDVQAHQGEGVPTPEKNTLSPNDGANPGSAPVTDRAVGGGPEGDGGMAKEAQSAPITHTESPTADTTPEQEETVSALERGQNIINQAQKQAESIIREAKGQEQAILAVTRNKARAESQAIIERARTEAGESRDRIIALARLEEQRLIDGANRERERIIAEAYEEKRRIMELKAEQEVQELVKSRLSSHMEKRSSLTEEQLQEMVRLEESVAEENNAIKDSVSAGVDEIKQVFDSVLKSFEGSMYAKVYEWQKGIYEGEFGSLVTCFLNLGKILKRMDKDIAEESVKGEGGCEQKLAVLTDYRERYGKFMAQLERALVRMGIKQYIPAPGESFNSYYHTHTIRDGVMGEDESYDGQAITRCSEPGIMMVRGKDESVIYRAVVDTENI